MDGKWIETIKMPGCYICRPVIKGESLAFAVIVTKDWGSYDGMLAILDSDYKVVSLPGGNSPKYIDNLLQRPVYDNALVLEIRTMFVLIVIGMFMCLNGIQVKYFQSN